MNIERSEGTRKQANANKQNDKKSLRNEIASLKAPMT